MARTNAGAPATRPAVVRTDPRIVQTERAVFAATVRLIEQHGPGEVTIERIATASGVARSTIYRRWANVDDLFLEAFDVITRAVPAPAPTGDLRADLQAFAAAHAGELNDRSFFAVLLYLMDESLRSRPYLARYRAITRARQKRVASIVRAARAGHPRPDDLDADRLADAVMAPLFHTRVGLHRRITDVDVREAVDAALVDAGVARPRRARASG